MPHTTFDTHTKLEAKLILYIFIFTLLDSRREDKSFWTEWYRNYDNSKVGKASVGPDE
jgi:hypothetical protein